MTSSEHEVPAGFRSGFAALAGRPNVGKSTLLNQLIGEVITIATPKPQTTRRRIRGIVNREKSQIVLVDTPGIHLMPGDDRQRKSKFALNRYMVAEAKAALSEVDLVVLLVEARGRGKLPELDDEDRLVMESLRQVECPRLLCINKVDVLENKEALLPIIAAYHETGLFEEIIPISATLGDGTDRLLLSIEQRLPEGPPYFPLDMITDQPERLLVAEFIREQVLLHTDQEIPYRTAVEVEAFEEVPAKKLVRIHATLFVERDSQKAILIGKRGGAIKAIGTAARENIEALLGCKVFLDLRVKVKGGWTASNQGLRSVGYDPS